jgi:hypothetical protein
MTTQNEKNAALISRIQKLMAMANHAGSNENEAAVAAAKVQELLTEHNLDMASIGGAEALSKAEARTKTPHNRAAMYQYQRDLMAALAENNFCMHFIQEMNKPDPRSKRDVLVDGQWVRGRSVKCHVLLGREVNVVTTRMTYDYLVDAMDRLLPWQGMEKRGKDALLWLAGCTDRLVERLAARRAEMEAESRKKAEEEKVRSRHPGAASQGNALVVLTDVYGSEAELNQDALYGLEPGTTAAERRKREAIRAAEQKLREEGHSWNDAYYLARGMEIPKVPARPVETAPAKPMSPSERRRREEAAQRANQRFWDRQARQEYSERQKKSHPSYKAGKDKGDAIGLDPQIGNQSNRRIK